MLRYVSQDTSVVFSEIPDEITLAINISGCPHRCPGCHSPYLQEENGDILDEDALDQLIKHNPGITCVLFMGGDGDKERVKELASYVSLKGLRTAWYSGESELNTYEFGWYFDYIKIGPYVKEKGPLNNPTTNQRLYKIDRLHNQKQIVMRDITNRFWIY